jgi:hypothetical protein
VSMVEGSSEGEVTYVWLTCDAWEINKIKKEERENFNSFLLI